MFESDLSILIRILVIVVLAGSLGRERENADGKWIIFADEICTKHSFPVNK